MNPYQSPMPIDEESRSWLNLLLAGSLEAFLFTLGYIGLLAVALLLLAVMPVAIGLAWYQFRKSWALIDLFLATVMTAMLPYWSNAMFGELGRFLLGRI